jgi:hypothetical protein
VIRRDVDGEEIVQRIDRSGGIVGRSIAPWGASPGCSSNGDLIYFIDTRSWTANKCGSSGCRQFTDRRAMALSVSPDGRRLAMMSFEQRGVVIWWIGADGGKTYDVAETETACAPGWASTGTLWVSRRRNGKPIWTEVEVESGRETGKTSPGARDCSDGKPDPASPVDPDLRIVYDQTSQVRLLGREQLKRN